MGKTCPRERTITWKDPKIEVDAARKDGWNRLAARLPLQPHRYGSRRSGVHAGRLGDGLCRTHGAAGRNQLYDPGAQDQLSTEGHHGDRQDTFCEGSLIYIESARRLPKRVSPDETGKLYAHATTSCMIFRPPKIGFRSEPRSDTS